MAVRTNRHHDLAKSTVIDDANAFGGRYGQEWDYLQ
jgi:hypothetical protein